MRWQDNEAMAARSVASWDHLCMFLNGSRDSFTGRLLELVAKADPGNRERLRHGFPRQVAAWEVWMERAPGITFAELDEATLERAGAATRLGERHNGVIRMLLDISDEDLSDALILLGDDKRSRLRKALGIS